MITNEEIFARDNEPIAITPVTVDSPKNNKKKNSVVRKMKNYNVLFDKIISQKKLHYQESLMLCYFLRNSYDNIVTLGYAKISNDLNISKPTVQKAIKGLIEKGLIERLKKGNPNLYIRGNSVSIYRIKI